MARKFKIIPNFSNYLIFGLSTHEKDYKLCWRINKLLQMTLSRYLSLKIPGDPELSFSLFVQEEVHEHVDVFLISNFDKNIPWFAQAKHFHYFFIIRGNPLESQIKQIIEALENMPQMQLVTFLSIKEKKLVEPLLTDFELHLTEIIRQEKDQIKQRTPQRVGIKKSKQN